MRRNEEIGVVWGIGWRRRRGREEGREEGRVEEEEGMWEGVGLGEVVDPCGLVLRKEKPDHD